MITISKFTCNRHDKRLSGHKKCSRLASLAKLMTAFAFSGSTLAAQAQNDDEFNMVCWAGPGILNDGTVLQINPRGEVYIARTSAVQSQSTRR